ncbi:COG4315 family predicted lipoprotein [Microbacterium hydrocarbonoxydans]|jgi:predicted lipoprotein with Yx(FWY)xxD motif|uniref:COG4315 family predicted lipoprotein n=1 Tax=Microbacterium hydrocarbonoxydans TaxID=273678 RepID=UPI003D978481
MLSRFRKTAALAALVMAFTVTACSSPSGGAGGGSDDSGGGAYASPSEEASTPADDAGAAELMVADSSLGEVVVDGDGMTLYMFDKDTQGSGASSCTGECLTNWPPLTTDGTPTLDGVTGEVGTITTADGSTQVTLNGWPLYYFAGDAAAGDVNGQGVGGVWWVLTSAGERMAG